ncbi:hypothetical protein BZG36_02310 [Bifiguratus adelaidae]|uniref:Succinate dehydrogenase assembly factor 4, mitochondrial n=1 Tax=Bifiguratus adelaidae TaxID=1938954 RepID=A0A261Y3S8_9FUNG|nr:hypothetical protein BZG36_02310 [Bifiguratus adelaidae]
MHRLNVGHNRMVALRPSYKALPSMRVKPMSSFNRPSPVPLGDKKAQEEFQELVRKKHDSGFVAADASAKEVEEAMLHPDTRRKPKPEFEGDKNPKTGEIGGPKNEPVKHGDWSFGGRVTDF